MHLPVQSVHRTSACFASSGLMPSAVDEVSQRMSFWAVQHRPPQTFSASSGEDIMASKVITPLRSRLSRMLEKLRFSACLMWLLQYWPFGRISINSSSGACWDVAGLEFSSRATSVGESGISLYLASIVYSVWKNGVPTFAELMTLILNCALGVREYPSRLYSIVIQTLTSWSQFKLFIVTDTDAKLNESHYSYSRVV